MKNLFKLPRKTQTRDAVYPAGPSSALSVGLHPKFNLSVPPIPHPTPYYRIAILATKDALLIRPVIPGTPSLFSYVRVPWGDTFEPEEVSNQGELSEIAWDDAAIVFGILGCLKLTAGAYMLVITAKTDSGNFLDSRNEVYGVKSASAIPMQESRARTVINTITIKYKQASMFRRPPLQGSDPSDLGDSLEDRDQEPEASAQVTKVKFSDVHDIQVMSPLSDREFRPSSPTPSAHSSMTSGASTPTAGSDENASVTKALLSRMSFWTRLPQRQRQTPLHLNDPEEKQLQDTNVNDSEEPGDVLQDIINASPSAPSTIEERQDVLDEKILRQCVKEFTKGTMFFAYNFAQPCSTATHKDITTSLQHKQHEVARLKRKTAPEIDGPGPGYAEAGQTDVLAEPHPTLPLWRRVTKQFWWNEHMLQPFIDANLHSYVLPVMQGFYQSASFEVPYKPESLESGEKAIVEYILVSRRSRERAGLRYQRRGVDDDANVANFVETESIVRVERQGIPNVFSYIQIRGSIPLFWTQSGYSLKPPPILSPGRTHEHNLAALRRHFSKTIPRYGPHTIVNLAEQQGKEGAITSAYRDYVGELGSKDVRYTEYDFHNETKGMHYENIASLINSLSKALDVQRFSWFSDGALMSEQKSVFRVNCIDCLDRTNVVQSAFARFLLDKQLSAVGLPIPPAAARSEIDIVFNDVWANNGDAISRAYAGTSALKGDYTRTGKRDLTGLLNDGMNSLARMYTSTFSDWFSQAVIDFLLGNRTLSVFSEFLEKMQSTDPRERVRTEAIRAEAIADSVSRVLSEGETLLSGWTLLSPAEINTKFSDRLEEKILLLSVRAVYVISYDYSLEKVAHYSRIPLDQITTITKGAYILSPLEEGSRDPLQNYGFMIVYFTSGETMRVTSYSLRNSMEMPSASTSPTPASPELPSSSKRGSVLSRILTNSAAERGDVTSFVAFKAMPVDPVRSRRTTGSFEESANDLSWVKSCKEAVDTMVDTIFQSVVAVKDIGREDGCFIKSEPIVSLEEAQRATTVMAKMEYGIKRLLWLGS